LITGRNVEEIFYFSTKKSSRNGRGKELQNNAWNFIRDEKKISSRSIVPAVERKMCISNY